MGTTHGATWAELLAQAILHTLVASLLVEALVRSWRVREPGQRMALRLVARFAGQPLAERTARQMDYEWRDR